MSLEGSGNKAGKDKQSKRTRRCEETEMDRLGQINTPRQIRSEWKAKAPDQSHKTDTYEREADRKRSDARVSQLQSL